MERVIPLLNILSKIATNKGVVETMRLTFEAFEYTSALFSNTKYIVTPKNPAKAEYNSTFNDINLRAKGDKTRRHIVAKTNLSNRISTGVKSLNKTLQLTGKSFSYDAKILN